MKDEKVRKLVFAALMTAVTTVATAVLYIPLPYGFANLGDAAVLLSGGLIGGPFGVLAAAVGSALADIVLGFTVYAPATFVIKGGMAALFMAVYGKKHTVLRCVLAAVLAETVMVGGYFLYETVLYGAPAAAMSVLGNAVQGGIGAALACIILPLLKRSKFL